LAEWRIGRGWSQREIAAHLALLEELPVTAAVPADDGSADGEGWSRERSESIVATEPVGPPLQGGAFASARQAVERYAFSDPKIVTAYFDPDRPLLGRPMLLELHVLGLRYLCGTVVGAVRDERHPGQTRFGFRYDTLEGHVERGSEWFEVEKVHATGEVRFCIRSRWREGDFPNWWSRAGFAILARPYRARWLRNAQNRLRALLAARSSLHVARRAS
jgi:uncharacterized protein (UPF0548 family)